MRDDASRHNAWAGSFPGFRIPFDDELAVPRLSAALDQMFQRADDREIVVVCVGTDRSTGDAFGPIIGTKLQHSTDVTVYGTLDEPVHAVNLGATLERLQKKHGRRPFVLAVDACLGRFDHVGQIILEEGPLRPGAGVKKSLPEFGDFTLTGVVNVCGFMEYFVLQNTRLGVVMRMTDTVVEALRNSLYRLRTRQRIIESVQGH
ncbi:spore protease YyaC [Alicyclobacillus macrosporangiidus]|uniref:spore protease YyaC n=1 Tax=Alicyclobacillus macrosporangiidus TaxID=392015 RepID=UPI00069157DC|nr:spore protease YyaC [Alicyclobacillus macrosporangiidus]